MLYKKYTIEFYYKMPVIMDVINNSSAEDNYNGDMNIKISYSYQKSDILITKFIDNNGIVSDYPTYFNFIEDAEYILDIKGIEISNLMYNYTNSFIKINEVYDNTPIDIKILRKYKLNKLLNNGTYIPTFS